MLGHCPVQLKIIPDIEGSKVRIVAKNISKVCRGTGQRDIEKAVEEASPLLPMGRDSSLAKVKTVTFMR